MKDRIDFTPLSKQQSNPWDRSDDLLWLLTPEELEKVPGGAILTSIGGEKVTKGIDYIDDDTRFGFLAYGFLESELDPELPQEVMTDE